MGSWGHFLKKTTKDRNVFSSKKIGSFEKYSNSGSSNVGSFFLPPDVSEGAELVKHYVPPHLLATYLTPVERGAHVWRIYEDIKPVVNTLCSFTQEVWT